MACFLSLSTFKSTILLKLRTFMKLFGDILTKASHIKTTKKTPARTYRFIWKLSITVRPYRAQWNRYSINGFKPYCENPIAFP